MARHQQTNIAAFIQTLEAEFERQANAKIASEQKAYLRSQFACYGLKTADRREIQKPFFTKEFLPPKSDMKEIIKILWQKPQREYHYFSQELAYKYIKQLEKSDIALFEFMVTHQSWWDTVDFIANKLIGAYFETYPGQRDLYIEKWLKSKNIWLQRSALLFQLRYKAHLDTGLLSFIIKSLLPSKEFFINKAIGWILREYSRTDPEWVIDFVNNTALAPLSKREALRLIHQKTGTLSS